MISGVENMNVNLFVLSENKKIARRNCCAWTNYYINKVGIVCNQQPQTKQYTYFKLYNKHLRLYERLILYIIFLINFFLIYLGIHSYASASQNSKIIRFYLNIKCFTIFEKNTIKMPTINTIIHVKWQFQTTFASIRWIFVNSYGFDIIHRSYAHISNV